MTEVAWGLNLEDTAIIAVKLRSNGDVPELLEYVIAPIPAGMTGRGPIERRDALAKLTRRLGLRDVEVHVGAVDTACILRDEDLDPEDGDAPPDVKRRHLISLLPGDPEGLEIRYLPGVENSGPDQLRFRLLGVPREPIDRTAAMLADAGIAYVGLHAGALAPAEAMRTLSSVGTGALLRIGARVTILEIHGATRIDRYRIPFGSDDLEAAVAAGSGAGASAAVDALAGSASGPNAAHTLSLVTPPVTALAEDIARLLAFHASRGRETAPESVHPCGYVANLPLVLMALRQAPSLTLESIPAPSTTTLARSGRAGRADFDTAWPTVLPAIGVALLGTRANQPELVLRPLTSRPPIRRRALWFAAAAIVVFLSLAAWGVANRRAGRLRELAERQTALLRVERGEAPTMTEVDEATARIDATIEYLERKAQAAKALSPVGWIIRTCDGSAFRFGRLDYADGRVRQAVLVVQTIPGTDMRAAADAHGRRITKRLVEDGYDGSGCEIATGENAYTLTLSWAVRP